MWFYINDNVNKNVKLWDWNMYNSENLYKFKIKKKSYVIIKKIALL